MSIFAGKNALIMGAGQNIGRQIALEWARRGARVAVADINAEGAAETAQMIMSAGGQAKGIMCDVTCENSVGAAIADAESAFGAIDIHMNNAGIIHSGNPEDFPPTEWERMFNVNFFGAVRANSIIMPKMIARGSGHIINTASFAGLYPFATSRVPYAASKAALISMSENMAIYLEPLGVRVSCLCPGPVMTTSTIGLKPWSDNVVFRGPGADLAVKNQEEVAVLLSDAMAAGEIFVPTHEQGYAIIKARAGAPDQFIHDKIAAFAAGKSGLPGRY